MDNLTLGLLGGILLVAALGLTSWGAKRYEAVIFLVALSPLISSFTSWNSADADVNATQETGIGSYVRLGILMLACALGLLQFIRSRSIGRRKTSIHFVLLGVFLVAALVSTIYSIDQQYTFVRSASFLALFGFLLGLDSWLEEERRFKQTLNTLLIVVGLVTFLSVLSMVFWPDRAWDESRFQGLWDHPNSMGGFCMLSYPLLLWMYPRSTALQKCLIAVLMAGLVVLHVMTGSRGSLIAALFGVCVWFVVRRKTTQLAVLLVVSAIGLLVSMQLKPSSFERDGLYSLTDLTDRQDFWYGSMTLIREKPLLGYGYGVEGGVWNDPRFNQPEYSLWKGTARASLHNGYLSVAIGIGLVALVVWLVILVIPLWKLRRSVYLDYKAVAMAILLASMLLNFVEGEIGGTAAVFWIMWVIAGKLWQVGPARAAEASPAAA
jgi:O-antigen ligase